VRDLWYVKDKMIFEEMQNIIQGMLAVKK